MGEQLGYFGVVMNALPVPLPETHRVKWQPIAEYDCRSNVLFSATTLEGQLEAFGCWHDDFQGYCEVFGCEIVPLAWSPESFSYLSDELAFALAVI